MSWLRQAGLWLGKSEVKEKVSVETPPRHLLTSLLRFVEARHPYSGGHLWRVSRYAMFSEATAAHAGATLTEHQGRPADLEPDLNDELSRRIVIASVDAMPAMALLATSSTYQASH